MLPKMLVNEFHFVVFCLKIYRGNRCAETYFWSYSLYFFLGGSSINTLCADHHNYKGLFLINNSGCAMVLVRNTPFKIVPFYLFISYYKKALIITHALTIL